jgi:hypothetical protein
MDPTTESPHVDTHDPDERKYFRSQAKAGWAQVAIAVVSALAVIVAIVVAWQGQITVRSNTQTALRQSEDSQLSTAITSLGSSDASERIAGLLLLARNTTGRFSQFTQTGESRTNVYDDYTTALQILSGYLNSGTEVYLSASASQSAIPFGRGYGAPSIADQAIDLTYAADQVRYLLSARVAAAVARLGTGGLPAIDLSNDELYDQSWTYVNFSWVIAYMPGIDLRGADLALSRWGAHDDLAHAYLQCADLSFATFRGANLGGADLRGALVQGTDFRGAHVRPLVAGTVVYGHATWSKLPPGIIVKPARQWNQQACLQDSQYWDMPPAAGPPAASPAPSGRSGQSSVK